ncbi:MAG: glutathione S-transferase family protein [Proteobacteria bacterium]|nr:glutathione S-transferase family protein [Pseudomonadota bacterium]
MMKVFGLAKTWDFPDASPYVCKLVMWLRMAGLPYELIYVPWPQMIERAPRKSVPWIEDADGEVIHDSQRIIERLTAKRGIRLDAHLTTRERAEMRAWQRLLEDHYYWAGLVQMRWVEDHNWAIYKKELAAELEPSPEIEQFFQEIRDYLVAEFRGHAVGKMTLDEVRAVAHQDLDALADHLGDEAYFMGARPTIIDAVLYACLLQTYAAPRSSPVVAYARSKRNLEDYFNRLHAQYWSA